MPACLLVQVTQDFDASKIVANSTGMHSVAIVAGDAIGVRISHVVSLL